MKKRLLIMSSILVLCVASMSGCGNKSSKAAEIPQIKETDNVKVEEKTFKVDESGYALAASNDKYEMFVDKDVNAIRVKEMKSGNVWDSSMDVQKVGLDIESVSPAKLKRYASPLQITYYNAEKENGAAITAYLGEFKFSGIKTFLIKDKNDKDAGVRAQYALRDYGNDKDINITLTVDYYLTEDGFSVRIPVNAVQEKGDYDIIAVSVLPYMAAASNADDGFYLYPDGSGAIMEFKDNAHHGEQDVSYNIYGNLLNYKNSLDQWAEKDAEVFMPIYGANINNNSFLAFIDKGEESARVKVSPSKSEIEPVNYLSCEFVFRNAFDDLRFKTAGSNTQVLMYDEDLLNIERSVTYHLFEPGQATTYSDMAVCYRDYLMDNGVTAKKETNNIPLSVDFFMGIKEAGLVQDSFKAVTTFKQADKMIEELEASGVKSLDVQLKGWTKNGYYADPIQFPVNSDLGGNNGLKDLTKKYQDKDGVNINLETNLIEARASEKGYNMSTDTLTLGNYSIFSDFGNKMYLLSPNVAKGNFNQLMKDSKEYSVNGVNFYSLGQYLLYNYNSDNKVNLAQCKLIWQSMLKDAKDTYDTVIVQGGNQYVLQSADRVTDIPYEDAGYRITTKSVPVYQIALHGLVEFTGQAGNLSSDLTEEKLKWVEYGYTPYFELSYDGSEELMHTDYNNLFSSTFSTWKDEAVKIYKEYNDNLKDVWHAFIVNHEEIATDVYKVTYDNGKVVYVNYNDKEYVVDNSTTVDANSYLVK